MNKQSLSHPEEILVIKQDLLLPNISKIVGFSAQGLDHFVQIIIQHQEYIPRDCAEKDLNYKQIIPYMVFTTDNNAKIFVMQRKATAGEQRLANKYSIGIGGHMRRQDLLGTTIFDWAKREWQEEVSYSGAFTVTPIGIVNDDSNDVGKVHIGLVLLVQGDSEEITIKDEHKSGQLLSIEQAKELYPKMESWSQKVFDLFA